MNKYLVRVCESNGKKYNVEVHADYSSVHENGTLTFIRVVNKPVNYHTGTYHRQAAAFTNWVYFKMIIDDTEE